MPRLLVAALVLAGGLALAGCGGNAPDVPTAPSTGIHPVADTWTRLPDSPLSPRENPAIAHVGHSVVLIGGYTGPPCPPAADCGIPPDTTASDGAALDLADGTWRSIADAPRPVAASSRTAVIDDTVYVVSDRHVLAWDSRDDTWTELTPLTRVAWADPVADVQGDTSRLVLASGSDENGVQPDQVYDPATGKWSVLPPNPLRPTFDRFLLSTPAGLVLTAKSIGPDGRPADPSLVHAAVLAPGATEWRTLPPAEDQLGGWSWTWSGTRLVDPTPGGADGGEVNGYGRTIPFGGALDPVTGVWSPLDDVPAQNSGGWAVEALGGRYSAVEGWLYDDGDAAGDDRGWARIVRPDDAPSQPGRAVWADDLLVVVGGSDWGDLDEPDDWTPENVWSGGTWAYRVGPSQD